jgi:spore germination protein YaaH
MNRIVIFAVVLPMLFSGFFFVPAAEAAPKFEVAGWIPYWRKAPGTADALSHLDTFTSVMPFGYIAQNDGTLHDAFDFDDPSATSTANLLIATARAQKVRIIPSIMWSNGAAMHAVLKKAKTRIALEDRIAALVKEKGFDGIDIDFESKLYESGPYFSLFLKGLYARLGNKLLYCTIEPRTPPSSAFDVIPEKLEYVNDYTVINKYCDRVQIMAYDQGTTDLRLNAAANGTPYVPVADVRWVQKVLTLASGFIAKNKLVLGIPTYGYEYEVTKLSTSGYRYTLNWALNPAYATGLAAQLGITPDRNSAGEMSFMYVPTTTPQLANSIPPSPHIVWWSDAGAINDKVQLARKMGIRGVAIFKIDGGQDPNIWNVLPKK